MLGHRGCRLGNTYPEITRCRHVLSWCCINEKKEGVETHPEIMVPLTAFLYEFLRNRKM